MEIRRLAEKRNDQAERDAAALLRNYIDAIPASHEFAVREASPFWGMKRSVLRRVRGMSRDEKCDAALLHGRIAEALSGLSASRTGTGTNLAFAVTSDGAQASFHIGAMNAADAERVGAAMQGSLEDIAWGEARSLEEILRAPFGPARSVGGVITGIPSVPEEGKEYRNPIVTVVRGMQGRPFALAVLCVPRVGSDVNADLARNAAKQSGADADLNAQYSASETSRLTESVVMYAVKRYLSLLQKTEAQLLDAQVNGSWSVCFAYMARNEQDAQSLSALLRTGLSGQNSGPEPVRATPIPRVLEGYICGPSGCGVPVYNRNELSTALSSRQLASMMMFPDREVPGFFVNEHVDFDMTARVLSDRGRLMELGDVLFSVYGDRRVDKYQFPLSDLDRHALVVGATGGGKSNTTRSLLKKLWANGIPFMVIESAKSEYWQLAKVSGFRGKLCALQLGSVNSPFKLNPFECIEGFSLQTHVDSLLATFNAAFEMYAPMPYILERAVYQVYKKYGWDIASGANTPQTDVGGRALPARYPTLSDLYLEIPIVVEGTAYDSEVKNNVQGALQTRVRSLMTGGKGKMMDVRRSTPMDALLKRPLVLELESLGDDAVKSFCIGLLMNRLYEYRRAHSDGEGKPFSHLLVLEEAHRLLKRIPEQTEGGNPQAASVAFFCNMLSEIRSYGQGILIADQSPMKLAQDAIRNTNLKIVHRIVDSQDREAVGGAMHMNERQIEALTVLRRGAAAVYAEGDHRPRVVQMELVKFEAAARSRADVLAESRRIVAALLPPDGKCLTAACRYCANRMSSGACANAAQRTAMERAVRLFLSDAARREQAEQLLDDNGPDEELIHEIASTALRGAGTPAFEDDSGRIRRDTVSKLLCAAGFALQGLKVSDESQEVAAARYCKLLKNRSGS